MAGRRQGLDREPAGFELALHDRAVVATADLIVSRDVVLVGVRREQVRDRQVMAVHCLEERLQRRPGVDEDAGAAFPIADQVGVRKPVRVHAPLDDHRLGTLDVPHREEDEWPA